MKHIRILITALILCSCCNIIAQSRYIPKSSGEVVSHTYYTLSYVESAEQAEWVCYELTPQMITGSVSRTDDFREDRSVATGSSQLIDYKSSGYDRGHLAPAGSMRLNRRSMSESFLMSNMSPQVPSFNRGGWSALEELVRAWAMKDSLLCVVTGGVLGGDMERIGVNRVAVPNHYYKIIYAPNQQRMIAFLLPNAKVTRPLASYVVTTDHVEEITGIDFFHSLPDGLEQRLESGVEILHWDFSSTFDREVVHRSASTTSSTSTQCLGTTKSGNRCKNKTTSADGYCHLHKNQL